MRLTLAFLVVLAGCASQATTGGAVSESVRIGSGTTGGNLSITPNSGVAVTTVAMPIDAVWRALASVYDSLGITVATMDTRTRTLGNSGFKVRRQLGKVPLSRYIECGTTQIGPNADSYDVNLVLLTRLESEAGGGTRISTTFEASARPISFSQAYSNCSSKAVLEARIIDGVKSRMPK